MILARAKNDTKHHNTHRSTQTPQLTSLGPTTTTTTTSRAATQIYTPKFKNEAPRRIPSDGGRRRGRGRRRRLAGHRRRGETGESRRRGIRAVRSRPSVARRRAGAGGRDAVSRVRVPRGDGRGGAGESGSDIFASVPPLLPPSPTRHCAVPTIVIRFVIFPRAVSYPPLIGRHPPPPPPYRCTRHRPKPRSLGDSQAT